MKAETDLGNGLTGFGKYEWDVDENDFLIRQRIVGVKGDFGKVTLGKTYHTFYNYVVGPADSPWWVSGYAIISYRGRTDDGLSYNYSSDAFNFGVTAYMFREDGTAAVAAVPASTATDPLTVGNVAVAAVPGNEEAIDQLEVGVSFGIGDMTLGIALLTTEDDSVLGTGVEIGNGSDEDILGFSLSGISLGDASLGFGLQTQDEDTSFLADLLIGDLYIHVEQESLDAGSKANTADEDRLGITIGYTQSLGKDTLIYYELYSLDNDTGDSNDDLTAVMAVLKYNLL